MMLEFNQQGKISLEKIVEKMCHKPAICFDVKERGFVREGYFADLVLLDLNKSYKVGDANDAGKIHYKCGWSPLEGHTFKGKVQHTFVSGHLAYSHGQFNESKTGERLYFNR
jgi:dihydroorotase